MGEALKELASSGAIGAALVVVLGMLFWLMKVLVTNNTEQSKAVIKALGELVESSRAIRDNCRNCREDSVASLRDAQVSIETKIEHTVWQSHDKNALERDKSFATMTDVISKEITQSANSIRSSNAELVKNAENQRLRDEVEELSRPHHLDEEKSGVVRR